MKKGNVFTVLFRRKREGKTHYRKRLKILTPHKFRFVVRGSLKNVQVSVIEYDAKGDNVLFTVHSKALHKFGWKGYNGNVPSAYLTGLFAGKKAIEKGVKEAILDLGLNKSTKGSRLYAALAGAIDAGLKIPFAQDMFPSKERISGEHIAKYAQILKNDKAKFDRQFSNYINIGLNPEDIINHFNEVKSKING